MLNRISSIATGGMPHLLLHAFILMTAIVAIAPFAHAADTYTELFRTAMAHERRGETLAADQIYTSILSSTTTHETAVVRAYSSRGALANRLGDTDKALQNYQTVHATYPGNFQTPRISLEYARLLIAENRIPAATTVYEQMLDRYGRSESSTIAPSALYGLARCKELSGDGPGATQLFNEIVATWPTSMEAIMIRQGLESGL